MWTFWLAVGAFETAQQVDSFLQTSVHCKFGFGDATWRLTVDRLIDAVAADPRHFQKLGITLVGVMSPEERIESVGLNDVASITNQYSEAAQVAREREKTLTQAVDAEVYSDVVKLLPTVDQIDFWDRLNSLVTATTQVLDSMAARVKNTTRTGGS